MADSREAKKARTADAPREGAIVTGAASGIGLATAKLMSARGCRVLLADRDEEKGRKEAAALGQLYRHVDVSDEASVRSLVAHAKEALPGVSYLVNSAGCDFSGDFGDGYSSSMFDRAVQVNLRSVFLMCREALPLLKASRGSVVNVASIQGHRSFANFSAYAATKGGMVSLSRQLAGDLARFGVRVNTVSPGAVHTSLGANSARFEGQPGGSEALPSVAPDELLGVLPPEDVAEAVVSLLSLRGVTGQDLVVDGGCSIIGVNWWRPFPVTGLPLGEPDAGAGVGA